MTGFDDNLGRPNEVMELKDVEAAYLFASRVIVVNEPRID